MMVLVILAVALVCAIVRGMVLSVLWFWFLVPLGVPPIETAHAIGISILAGMFTAGYSDKSKDERVGEGIMGIAYPIVALLMGWLAHSAM
jgi:hypothetical protein